MALASLAAAATPATVQVREPARVRIAAASDLRFALEDVLGHFHAANPAIRAEAVYGSSGNFFAQVREGAPYDIFLSADVEYVRRLFAEGLGEAPFSYAVGRLALVVRKETGLDPRGFADLLRSVAVRRIAIANPRHAPYGRAAEAVLRTWNIYDAVAPRLVFGDSVSQAAQFVDTGAAQAGIVALALVHKNPKDLAFAEVPAAAHPPLEQAGLILKRAEAPEAARAFQTFLTGQTGRRILSDHGFGLP